MKQRFFHVEAEVIIAYLEEIAKKLKQDGIGFIHHSNIGEYRQELSINRLVPDILRKPFINWGLIENTHWRAYSVTAKLFEESCQKVGLQCISQELVNWGSDKLIDCFSLFTPKASRYSKPNIVTSNYKFMEEASRIKLNLGN